MMRARFGYCFASPPGSEYPPIVTEHRLAAGAADHHRGQGGPITALPILQDHGDIASLRLPLRRAWPIPATSAACRPQSVAALAGLDVWIVDALRYRPHPSHFSLDRRARDGSSASSRAAPS